MPFKSEAQRGYLYTHLPEIAKKFQAETPKGTKLPSHKKKNMRKKIKAKMHGK